MATGEVRQAGPALHPALGIRISQRFSDVREGGLERLARSPTQPSCFLVIKSGPFRVGCVGGVCAGSHGNTVEMVVSGDVAERKGGVIPLEAVAWRLRTFRLNNFDFSFFLDLSGSFFFPSTSKVTKNLVS